VCGPFHSVVDATDNFGMTWLSGSCSSTYGAAYVITDAYPEGVIRISDEDVRADQMSDDGGYADEAERQRVVLDESVGFPRVERGLYQP